MKELTDQLVNKLADYGASKKHGEPHEIDIARDICKEILELMNADDMGGCPLCQS